MKSKNGTWLFEILTSAPRDQYGGFCEVGALGASVEAMGPQLQHLLPAAGGDNGVMHICVTQTVACAASASGRQAFRPAPQTPDAGTAWM